MRKKKIVFHSNHHSAFTGFGKNTKNVLKYLHNTGKYDIIEAANGILFSEQADINYPWKVYGTIPNDNNLIERSKTDQLFSRQLSYGVFGIDRIIEKEKPDIYIGVEDIWAFNEIIYKPWWNKINCMIWTTLDSLPLLPDAIINSDRINNYYVWSEFAEQEAKRLNINNIKTLHGAVDQSHFYRLSYEKRSELRKKFGLSNDLFITGFVFRNQLRKTVGDLLAAHALVKKSNPEINHKVLLHTSWSEGWDIHRLMMDYGVSKSDVLTTYFCSNCKNYVIAEFGGHQAKCPYCQNNSMTTSSITNGVNESQLNEIYNLMDFYAHPFTSGGQELPIQEAKLTQLITGVTNYTCGTSMCSKESGGIPFEWFPYREIGTQFIKASTSPISIAKSIISVYKMSEQERLEMGLTARDFIIKNYSINSVGKKLEEILENMPLSEYSYDIKYDNSPNPLFIPKNDYKSETDFICYLFENFLKQRVDQNSKDFHYIKKLLSDKKPAAEIINLFKKSALDILNSKNEIILEELLSTDKCKKIAIVIPNDSFIALVCSYFIKSINELYPEYHLYVVVSNKLKTMFVNYPYIYKILEYGSIFENQIVMEGMGNHLGYFDICLIPCKHELNAATHSHNCLDRSGLCI